LLLLHGSAAVSDSQSIPVAVELSQELDMDAVDNDSILNASQVMSSMAEAL
jgi:hypothetical protein